MHGPRTPARAGNASLHQARLLALAVPALLLGGAYLSEYGFGLYPCEMCWWQRYPHFVAVALASMAFFLRPARLWVALAALAILVSGVIGVFHAGVEYGWWQGITDCATLATQPGLSPIDAITSTPSVRCDTPQWTLAGISLAGWNALFSRAGGVAVLFLLSKKDRP